MCDFHSIVVRADGAVHHVAENSHSKAVQSAGWRENRPHARPGFIEAEWDGRGEYPGADKICRVPNGEKMTARQRCAVDGHYQALALMLQNKAPLAGFVARFAEPEYSDVLSHSIIHAHPEVPKMLGYLQDRVRVALLDYDRPVGLAWPRRFIDSVRPGADIELVWPRFALWMLSDPDAGVIRFAKTESRRAAILGVSALFQRWLDGAKPPASEWKSARGSAADAYAADAYAYAAYAAYAYAYAADAYAADAYAYAAYAYAADAYAADAYAYAAAADADARKKHYQLMAEKILALVSAS